ncbi:alpha-xenorhabdolysin family binary toxin subunit B [Variovorax sp. J22R133]|uniref:alpha-xenorhabdolysin family binary toxin subunit B n=1 Tax=Variovorax brevis TaxID=3053503 RepID=UPI002578B640|nr:alpha-xenorhabdolysin family binary toxin subunit B [Variovorax sp. J22R133]MDM0116129.1 alpha-xenorhabdolysin family binary toxin subunit B [Variovorax sp. J22R133]
MSNVTPIATAVTSYAEPDFNLIVQSTKDISRLAVFQTDKMMAVMDKAQRASGYALGLDKALGDQLVAVSTKAQSLDFSEIFSQIEEIDGEIAKGKLSPSEVKAAKEAREEQEGLFAQRIVDLKATLRGAASQLNQKAAEVRGVVLAERTQETLTQQEQRRPELVKAIADKRDEWKSLDADRKKIIDAQDVIRARGLIDIYKDYIPKDLEKVDLKKPEAEAIRLGVELLKKIMGEVSEGFKYSDLADQRKVFDGKIEQLDRDIQGLVAEQRANDALISDLSAVMAIDAKRNDLVGEANKVPVALTGFAAELDALNGPAVTEASVSKVMRSITTYTANCLDARNRVVIT